MSCRIVLVERPSITARMTIAFEDIQELLHSDKIIVAPQNVRLPRKSHCIASTAILKQISDLIHARLVRIVGNEVFSRLKEFVQIFLLIRQQ